MEIQKDIFSKYLEKAAIEQLAIEYQKQGYEVVREPLIGDLRADLMVKNDKETVVFEMKSGDWADEKRQSVGKLRNLAVHTLGARFKLVFVNLPVEPEIVIDGLDNVFFELLPEHFVNEFSQLATQFWINDVADIDIEELFVRKDTLEIAGSGTVSLGLQYGSDSDNDRDDGARMTESFQFVFRIRLDRDLKLIDVEYLELDKPEDVE